MDVYSTIKELHFSFLHQHSRIFYFFDSSQYHTVLRKVGIFMLSFEYLSKNDTKFENILTHWWVARAGLKDEKKTRGRKSLWTVPLRDVLSSNLNMCIVQRWWSIPPPPPQKEIESFRDKECTTNKN